MIRQKKKLYNNNICAECRPYLPTAHKIINFYNAHKFCFEIRVFAVIAQELC